MWDTKKAASLVRKFLPVQAHIFVSDEPVGKELICTADMDGDGVSEIVAAYSWNQETYLLLLDKSTHGWQVRTNQKGRGERICYLAVDPAEDGEKSRLVVGWSKKHTFPYLSVYEYTREGLMDATEQARSTPSYWYHLAGAQIKAHLPVKAIDAIEAGLCLQPGNSSKWNWKGLLQQIRYQLETRNVHLYPASVKTKDGTRWGYIDGNGNFVIPPQYDHAENFQENGLAVVNLKDHSGLINRHGQYVLQPIYNTITSFSEGRAEVLDDKGFWVIDETGKVLTEKPYSFIAMYQGGRAMYSDTNAQGQYRYGYLDKQGQVVIPLQYLSANDFQQGKAVVQIKEDEYALIGLNGERLHTYPYAFVGSMGDGLLAFAKSSQFNSLKGYIDEAGNVIIQPQFTTALPFEAERAVVNTNTSSDTITNQYGLIDKKGEFLIKPKYNDIQLLKEGRVAVGKARDERKPYIGSRFAIADVDGHFLTDFLYNEVGPYENGFASASDDQSTFFIDRSGQVVKSLPIVSGSGTLSFVGDVIKASVDQRVSYYDRDGRLIWKENTIIPLAGHDRIKELKYAPNKDYVVYYPQIEGMANRIAQERVNERLMELSQVKKVAPDEQSDYSYFGDFSVAFFKKYLLELELTGYKYPFGAAHGMPSRIFAHIDLSNGRMYELRDLFKPGSNYVQVLSDIVGNQIKTNPEYSYVFPDSYKGIKLDQPFYVKEDALYLYFEPYEIGPYAAGFPTFKIPFRDIINLIDTNGAFWKSFHE